MTFVIFDYEFCVPNLCEVMSMLNFMKLMCLCAQVHS